MIDYFVI